MSATLKPSMNCVRLNVWLVVAVYADVLVANKEFVKPAGAVVLRWTENLDAADIPASQRSNV